MWEPHDNSRKLQTWLGMVSGFSLCCTPTLYEGWGVGRMATTKAHWAQEAHLRPSESQGPILHIKMKRGLCKITHVHPKPTHHPIHTHAHTCAHIHTHTYPVLGLRVPRPQFLGEGEECLGLCMVGVDDTPSICKGATRTWSC